MRNKFILLFIALGASWCAANAQHADSLFASKPVNLSDVVVNGRSDNEGPSLNYYMRDKLSTTEEILERTAGVTLIRRGNYGMEPVLRSYSGGQINLTINGMKIFGACTDKMDPPTIYTEPENLNAISLTQGASGSRYGSTVGGSLDMEMKEAQCTPLRDFYFTTASSYSSVNNSYNGSFAVSSSGPKASFRLSGVYRKAFDYKTAGGVSVPHSGYEKANYLASAMFNIRPQQWLTLDYMGDLGWNIGYPALPMDVDRARANIGSVAYLVNPLQGTLKRVETKVYFNHIYHQMGNAERPEAPMPMDMPGWSYTAGAYSDMEFAAGKNNRLELRTDYYANFTKASMTMHWPGAADMYMLTLPDNLRQFAGAFVEDEWAIKPNHLLKFNVRGEIMHANMLSSIGKMQWGIFTMNSTDVTKFLPSASVKYSWLCPHNFALHLTAAYGASAPTANQLYGYYLFIPQDGYDYIGNASLKAEKSLQAEANLSYSGTIFRFSVTGYYHRLYDYILGTVKGEYPAFTIGSMGVKEYTNINSAFITGADASAGFTLKQGLQSVNTLGYAYGRLSGGSPVPLLSPLRGINSLGYGIKGWHIQAEGDWALAKNSVNTEIGETATAGYFLLNLRTGYKFVIHNHVLAIKFSVENVLDTKYREYADWGNVYRPGRNYVVYISYAFDKTLGCCVSKAKP